jgi:xanthine dehydrogenase YagT iron-sulfur-binding subunit
VVKAEGKPMQDDTKPVAGINRRTLMTATISAAAAIPLMRAGPASAKSGPAERIEKSGAVSVNLTINGQRRQLSVDVRTTLLDALRDHVGLTGTKKGCDHGQCGACTVHVSGNRQLSCMSLAVMHEGCEITTIEGLATASGVHPMQQAFIDHDALQCGYCTPGQIMAAIGCVKEGHAATPDEIREYMSGNLCRCAAYPNIVAAIEQARDEMGRA